MSHHVCASACWLVTPQCGFSLSLFCKYLDLVDLSTPYALPAHLELSPREAVGRPGEQYRAPGAGVYCQECEVANVHTWAQGITRQWCMLGNYS